MKISRRVFALFMAIVLVFSLCNVTGIEARAATKKPTKITLKTTYKTVDINGKVTVSVKTVKPDANITPAHVGNMPKPVQEPINPQNNAMKVIESTDKNFDFILTEAVDIFPVNTLFHFTKD